MPGPPPEPTQLRALRGNPGKRPLNDREPVPESGATPPEWLTPDARKHWSKIAPILESMNVLTVADSYALALLCDVLTQYVESMAYIREHGRTYLMPGKGDAQIPVSRPEVAMASDAWKRAMQMMDRFGMEPSYRAKLRVEIEPEVDPLEALRTRGSRRPTG